MAPFANDDRLKALVLHLLDTGCTMFVETGTYKGQTSAWVAQNWTGGGRTAVLTCEIDMELHSALRPLLEREPRIGSWLMPSPAFLWMVHDMAGAEPLIFLDAHWRDDWPLLDEIKAIGEHYDRAIVIIHDFVVPGRPNFFAAAGGGGEYGKDHHRPRELDVLPTLEYIQPSLSAKHKYQWFYPAYDGEWPGYIVIFQDVEPRGKELVNGNEY